MAKIPSRFATSVWPTKKEGLVKNDLTFIIAASTVGYRMKSYGPKSLYDVHGEYLIHRQINAIQSVYPNAEIIVVVGFNSDKVVKQLPPYIRVVENVQYSEYADAEDLRLGLFNSVTPNIVVVSGDLYFGESIIQNINNGHSSILIDANAPNFSTNMHTEDIGVNYTDSKVNIFSHGLDSKWYHIAYLTGREKKLCQDILKNKDNRRLFIYEIFNKIIDNGGKFEAIPKSGQLAYRLISKEELT